MSKRLHPAAMLLTSSKYAWSFFPLYTVVLYRLRNKLPFTTVLNTIILVALYIAVIGILSFWHWRKFTYTLQETSIVFEHGIFIRSKRSIPKERIQSLNESEDLIHRLFRLTKLQVDTAGGHRPELVLKAITKKEAEDIRLALSQRSETVGVPAHTFTLSRKRLWGYAATSGTIGVVFSALVGLYFEIDDYISLPIRVSDLSGKGSIFYIITIVLAACLIWFLGMLLLYQRYYNFRVVCEQKRLIITRGLLEKSKLILPLRRIQAVKIEENLVRQAFGFVTVHVISASGKEEDQHEKKLITFPLVKKEELPFLFQQFLPDFIVPERLHTLPKRAKNRYIIRALTPLIALGILAYYVSPVRYALPLAAIFLVVLGVARYRAGGWKITDQQYTMRKRFVSKTTVLVKRNRIQSLSVYANVLQEPASLCTTNIHVKSGVGKTVFSLKDIDDNDAKTIRQWYSYELQIEQKEAAILR